MTGGGGGKEKVTPWHVKPAQKRSKSKGLPILDEEAAVSSGKKKGGWVDLGAGVDGSGKSTPNGF